MALPPLFTGVVYDLPPQVYFPPRMRFGNGKRIGWPKREGVAFISAGEAGSARIGVGRPSTGRCSW